MKPLNVPFLLLVSVFLGPIACRPEGGTATPASEIVLASTTSTEDSGLFGVLIPAFERANPGLRLRVVAVGSGQALGLGRRRDADVLLVHSPAAEQEFMREGHGLDRRPVMKNVFVIAGPASDPAGVRAARTAAEAFATIARAGARFVSRGDDSGTHRKELAIWKAAGISPQGPWYVDAGQGMGEVLNMTNEMQAYTLTDIGTYLSMKNALDLEILFEGDPILDNPYHVITVAGARNPDGARRFAEWITGPEGQALIAAFHAQEFGRPLFEPAARAAVPSAAQPTAR